MSCVERAASFTCEGDRLFGIVSMPDSPFLASAASPPSAASAASAASATPASPVACSRGVLVVVGGPQYRAGSHRQFTLLCRTLAAQGIPAMRFDYRGMGDAEGAPRTFEEIDADIGAAIDCFCAQVEGLTQITICGLCDAASAAMFYAHRDSRVKGVVLINPWARTAAGIAKTHLRHYYRERITDKEFWRKLAHGEIAIGGALRSAVHTLWTALRGDRAEAVGVATAGAGTAGAEMAGVETAGAEKNSTEPARAGDNGNRSLPDRMADGLASFTGNVLLIRSGRDLTAQEFTGIADASPRWRKLLSATRVERRELPEADHTFSRREWRDQVANWTVSWVNSR